MTDSKRMMAAALALVVITATSSCTTNDPSPVSTSSSPTSITTTPPATTSTSLSPADQDRQRAENAVGKFWAVIDELAADPFSKLERITTVSRDQTAAQWRKNLMSDRGKGWKQVGKTKVASAEAKPSGSSSQFVVAACIDVSKVNIVDKDGKSVIAASRPPQVAYRFTVQEDNEKLYVITDEATGTC